LTGLAAGQFYRKPDIFVAALGEKSRLLAFEWICEFGDEGIRAEMDFAGKSLKSQMKRADRLEAGHVLIVGDDELGKDEAILRNMETKHQVSVPLDDLVANVKGKIITG
jgi:histidyl-tRNA synthetase